MRHQTDSRTLSLSLGKPRRQRSHQSGAAFLPRNPNLDVSGRRVVRAGCVVRLESVWQGEHTVIDMRVDRVRSGQFWHDGLSTPAFTPCCRVRVVNA